MIRDIKYHGALFHPMFDFGDPSWMSSLEGGLVVLAMSQLIDGECPECGGPLEKVGEYTYKCQECGTMFKAES